MAVRPLSKKIWPLTKCLEKGRAKAFGTIPVRYVISKQLVYSNYGDPLKVVHIRECQIAALGEEEVLVRMLAAAVNPSDINTIQGKYPVKNKPPAIAGNEGVGIVEKTGSNVSKFCMGDKVILTETEQGTWATYGKFHQNALKVVPNKLGNVEAATICVNSCTAYRMLMDFAPVRQKKLVVIQNGANSACGQNVIQLCKAWGIKNINVVRKRPQHIELKSYLESLGATCVLMEEEVRKTKIFKDGCIDKPSLALNCVGGKNSMAMAGHLKPGGCMVTYGGMSKRPVMVPTTAFIFKNITSKGFWITAWNKKNENKPLRDKMLTEIIALMYEGKLKGPVHKLVALSNFSEALNNTLNPKGFTGYTRNDKKVTEYEKRLIEDLFTSGHIEKVYYNRKYMSVCSVFKYNMKVLINKRINTVGNNNLKNLINGLFTETILKELVS